MLAVYHFLTNRFVKPVIEQHQAEGEARGMEMGRAEGVERNNREWREWLRRKEEHEATGLPFDEPPPDQAQSYDESRDESHSR